MAWVPAAIAIAQFASSAIGGARAKKANKRAYMSEAERLRKQTAEEIRRRTGQQAQELSGGTAVAGASGFAADITSGGYANVLEQMRTEFAKELAWMQESGDAQQITLQAQYKSGSSAISTGTASGALEAGKFYGQTQNWWAGK